ncbi:hypothetical protein [Streptomyces niveus]
MNQQRQYMLTLVQLLEERSAKDEKASSEASGELAILREAIANAERTALSATTRADASRWALSQAQEVFRCLTSDRQGSSEDAQRPPDKGREQPVTVVRAILDFLGERGKATTGEIVNAVRQTRPAADSSKVNPELTRLCRRGDITRIQTGLYQLARDAERDVSA